MNIEVLFLVIVIFIYIFILFIYFFLFNNKRHKIKGILGEKKVASILSSLPCKEYKVINDILIKSGNLTSQIDHVVVSIYGIFVIETKNYRGLITGFENSEYWIQNIFKNKYEFYNPIKQNKSHILTLCKQLHLKNDIFISIIVFSNKANLKVKTSQKIIHMSEINKLIKRHKKIKFSIDEVESLVKKIKSCNINTKAARKQHILSIENTLILKKKNNKYRI